MISKRHADLLARSIRGNGSGGTVRRKLAEMRKQGSTACDRCGAQDYITKYGSHNLRRDSDGELLCADCDAEKWN